MKGAVAFLLLLLTALPLSAHHSNAEYDRYTVTEIEGVITRVIWRNPHVGLEMDVTGADGSVTHWTMGAADLAGTLRRGVSAETFARGQRVKAAGFASMRRDANMLVTNVLLPDGLEVLLTGFSEPRWSENLRGGGNWVEQVAASADTQGAGIFRVWTLDRSNRPAFTQDPPLTDSARRAWEAYDPYNDDPALRCEPLGMPRVLTRTGPHPIEFVDNGDSILLRGEYFDVERVIHMSVVPVVVGRTPLGHSTGRWENGELVVETLAVNYPYFDIAGLEGAPQSDAVYFSERFRLNEDGSELHYSISITDPALFTTTVTADDYQVWKWRPGIEIRPYACQAD